MSRKSKLILGIILFVFFAIGLTIGIIWKDLPIVKFNPEIKIYEVANLLLTLIIGITIPLLVKKWIEDNRSVKISLVDEIKNILSTLNKIKLLLDNCHKCSTITKEQKDEINYLFHESELQINSLNEQLKISFDPQCKKIIDKLKENYHTYKDYLTGGELMLSSFVRVDDRFYREHKTEQSKIETYLKTVIHQIYKL
jgi:uncharacterized protein (DUF342 family)